MGTDAILHSSILCTDWNGKYGVVLHFFVAWKAFATAYYSQIIEDFAYGKENRVNNLGNWLLQREQQHWSHGYKLYKKSNALGVKSGFCNALTGLVQQAVSYAYLVSEVISNHITIGDFAMYVGGVAAFSDAMRSLMQNIVEVSEYRKPCGTRTTFMYWVLADITDTDLCATADVGNYANGSFEIYLDFLNNKYESYHASCAKKQRRSAELAG